MNEPSHISHPRSPRHKTRYLVLLAVIMVSPCTRVNIQAAEYQQRKESSYYYVPYMPMPPWVQPRAKKPAPKVMEPLPPIPGRPAFCQVRDYLAFENWEGNPHRDTTQYPQILAATQKDKVHRSRPSYRAAAQQLNKEVIVGSKLSTNEVKAKAVEVFGNWECGAAEGVPAAIIVNIGMFREALAEADPESEITFWQLLKATEGGMIHFANKVDQLSPKLGQHPVITKSCIAFRGARERPTGTKIKDEVEYD